MWRSKDVYYLSESTGFLAEDLGKSLTSQFPEISFNAERIPFIQTKEDAHTALEHIQAQSTGRYPLVFSTIMNKEIIRILDIPEVEFFSICDSYLEKLEVMLEAKPIRITGTARHLDESTMNRRVSAIQYSISHDDGTLLRDYDEAEVILLGVSRSGKTPISVYLATQMGIKVANYPLVEEDLNSLNLPSAIVKNKHKVIGLSTTPQSLHFFRDKRYKNSRYAELATCTHELSQSNQIFLRYDISIISSDGRSIEEIATQVLQNLSLSRLPHL